MIYVCVHNAGQCDCDDGWTGEECNEGKLHVYTCIFIYKQAVLHKSRVPLS